jgi:signal peptidase I
VTAGCAPPDGHPAPAGTQRASTRWPLYSRPVTSPFPPPEETPAPAVPQPSSGRRTLGCLFEIVETLVLTVVIFFVIQTFIAQPYQVRQQSMERTLEPGEYVLVDKLTPRWDTYKRGDIVVFEPPEGWSVDDDRTPFIKRVIGEPGDTVELVDGKVAINGTVINEPYIYEEPDGEPQQTEPTGGQSRWTIPAGDIFVMGDHRQASADSRTFGPVPESSIIGRAWLRYWPLDTFGVLQTPTYPELTSGVSGASAPLRWSLPRAA